VCVRFLDIGLCIWMSIRFFICVCIFFLSLTMKYLTLSILFQFIEGEGIPAGGDRIRYTYTLTSIIKLSYFLFNRYKTTTALPWLFISTFVPSLVHSITSRASLSRLVIFPRLFSSHISVYLPLSSHVHLLTHYSRPFTTSYYHNIVAVACVLLVVIVVIVTVGTINNKFARIAY